MNSRPGQSLGGNAVDLTPDQIRSRRLAALEGKGLPEVEAQAPNTFSVPTTLGTPSGSNDMEEDDEDAALQVALSMSMQKNNEDPVYILAER